jgi:hypothetical protein
VWPGARLTLGRLGLQLDWEPLPPPSGEPSAALQHAVLKEKRARDMELCAVERQVLTAPTQGRRAPPSYGRCEACGWTHALPALEELPHER